MAKKRRKIIRPLRTRVEKIVEESRQTDSVDNNILDHVRHFLSTPVPLMEKFSLESQGEAQKALVMLQKTHAMLEERIRTARMLKNLCEQAKEDETPEM